MAVSAWQAFSDIGSLAAVLSCIASLLTLAITAVGQAASNAKEAEAVEPLKHLKIPCEQDSSHTEKVADLQLRENALKGENEELSRQRSELREQHEALKKELEECKRKLDDVRLQLEESQMEAGNLRSERDERAERARHLISEFKVREKQDLEAMHADLDEGPVRVPATHPVKLIRPGQPKPDLPPADSDSDMDLVADERRTQLPRIMPLAQPRGKQPRRETVVELGASSGDESLPSLSRTLRQPCKDSPRANTRARAFHERHKSQPQHEASSAVPPAADDPVNVYRDVLTQREREVVSLQSLLQAAQRERIQFQEQTLENTCALHCERERASFLQAKVSALTADLGSLGDHVKQLEDECLSCRVQVESLWREKLALKEQLTAARETCSILQERAQEQAQSYADELAHKEASLNTERAALTTVQMELWDLRQSVGQLRAELNWKNAALERNRQRTAELDTDSHAIRRVAELLAQNAADVNAPQERRRAAQRRLLVCLHPDKCPATQIATELTQEVQRTRWWVN